MKRLPFVGLLALALVCVTYSQQGYTAPTVRGPVRTITYEKSSVTVNRDKTRIEQTSSDGRTYVWLCDTRGRALSFDSFEKDGRPHGFRRTFVYDTSGQLASTDLYLGGQLSSTVVFTYTDKFHVKIETTFEQSKVKTVETEELDKKGNVKRSTDSLTEFTSDYKYDDKDDLVEVVTFDKSGKQVLKMTWQFKFDAYGNWTTLHCERTTDHPFPGFTPTEDITRKLTYY